MALPTHVYESAVLTRSGQLEEMVDGYRHAYNATFAFEVLTHVGHIDELPHAGRFHRFFERLRNPWHDITG